METILSKNDIDSRKEIFLFVCPLLGKLNNLYAFCIMSVSVTRRLLPEIFGGEATHWQHPDQKNMKKIKRFS